MIPIRIGLQNFLTYATADGGGPVVLDFDEAALWSIAGNNGAGKSAIFDAVTYALYGEHRGGRQHDSRLIRKGAATAKVTFEFAHAGRRYKVERTVTRKIGRAGQPRPDAKSVHAAVWDDAEQVWLAVPDADRAMELERWIRSLLGMGAETFCASVLLRQGEADRLLTVPPDKRFKVLAGLIDLRAYQDLEQLALQRRKDSASKADLLEQQRASLGRVNEDDVAEAATTLQTAEAAVDAAERRRAAAETRWHGAQHHEELQRKHAKLSSRREMLHATVADANNIRRRAQEREELRGIIPPVREAIADLAAANDETKAAAKATEAMAAIDLPALEAAADHAQAALAKLSERLDTLIEHADGLSPIVAAAAGLHRCRKEYARRTELLDALGDPVELRAAVARLETKHRSVSDHKRTLQERHKTAVDLCGGAQQRFTLAQRRTQELHTLAGEVTCSRCGQPISPEHLHRERDDADAELEAATADLVAKRIAVEELDDALLETDSRLEELSSARTEAAAAAKAADTAEGELRRAANEVTAAQAACATLATPAHITSDLTTVITGTLDQAADALNALASVYADTQTEMKQVKTERDQARTDAASATDTFEKARRTHYELQRVAERADAEARHRTRQAEARLKAVPADVASAVRAHDGATLDQLTARLKALADAEDAMQRLKEAEHDLVGVEATLASVEDDLAAIPADHRILPADAKMTLDHAKQQQNEAQVMRDDARDRHRTLRQTLTSRRQLDQDLADARRRERAAQRLAILLGKGELQGRLLADATAGVSAYANDTLARISGGTLEVALHRQGADDATLDILVTDLSSTQEPLEIAFISGSQKFRVAVALAAGLGQYLGGAAAIRALIIDEGFGSLDTDGRQRMIQELRTLAEHLDRIIVVSHQEDFSDRTLFPNGYLLRKRGTRTTIERVG